MRNASLRQHSSWVDRRSAGIASLTLLAIALAARALGAAPAPGGIAGIPPGGIRVAEIDVRGNQQVSRDTILLSISTRAGQVATRQQLERDVEALRRTGLFREVSTPEVEITPEGARITFTVAEYPRVTGVEFRGNTLLTDEQLRALVSVQPGQLMDREALDRQLRAVEDAYRERGYAARVGEVEVTPEGIVRVPIREVRVAELEVEGLRRLREVVVRRALELQPGDLFNQQELQRDFLRLQQFNLFERIEPSVSGTETGDVVVGWDLEEARSRALNLGLTYSPAESLVGTVNFEERNFRGRAETLRVGLNVGTVEGGLGADLGYSTPVLGRRVGYTARAFSLLEYRFTQRLLTGVDLDIDRYRERHNGLQFGATSDLGRGRQVTLTGRFEDVSVSNLPPQFLEANTPSLDSSILAAGLQAVRDRRDFFFYPTQGDYASASVDLGFVSRGSGNSAGWMLKPQADWRVYLPLDRSTALNPADRQKERIRVVALRLRAGTSLGDLPFFEQHFVGGADGLRGYREDRFWGEHMVLANAELRWPLFGELVGVGFVDVGHAWGSDFQFATDGFSTGFRQQRGFKPRIGYGVGARYLSPLGPLRLDFGFGEDFRTHFSIGQTF